MQLNPVIVIAQVNRNCGEVNRLHIFLLSSLFLNYCYPEDGGRNLLRNINIYSAIYMAFCCVFDFFLHFN